MGECNRQKELREKGRGVRRFVMIDPIETRIVNPVLYAAPVQDAAQGKAGRSDAGLPAGVPQVDVVSISPQALNSMFNEDLAVAFNAAAPDAVASVPPVTPSVPMSQIEAIAARGASDPGLVSDLMNALGGPHYVAALMAAQQVGTPVEPLGPVVVPIAVDPSRTKG